MAKSLHDADEVALLIDRSVDSIIASFAAEETVNLVGVHTRGETLATRIARALEIRGYRSLRRGSVDITLYRDDLSEVGPRPVVRATQIEFAVDRRPLILVDDVLFTGRTVRAALEALADFGRPSVIRLLVLVDRGGRELPIQPDFVALELADVPRDHRVKVSLIEDDGIDEIRVEPIPMPGGSSR